MILYSFTTCFARVRHPDVARAEVVLDDLRRQLLGLGLTSARSPRSRSIVLWLQRNGRLVHSITEEHYHDIGKWMFAFTFFWAYTAFSQFMLQWYGNMPEETVWYKYRMFGEWQWVSHCDPRRLLGVPVRVPDVALDQAHRAVARVLRGVAARRSTGSTSTGT